MKNAQKKGILGFVIGFVVGVVLTAGLFLVFGPKEQPGQPDGGMQQGYQQQPQQPQQPQRP